MEQFFRGIVLCIGVIIGTVFLSSAFSTERYTNNKDMYIERLTKMKTKEEDDET